MKNNQPDFTPPTEPVEVPAELAAALPTKPDNTPAGDPDGVVRCARWAADLVNAGLANYNPDDWREALRILHRLRGVIETLRTVDANLVTWLYLHGEHGQHQVVDGIGGEVYIGRGRKKEVWASREAVLEFVERKMAAVEGEIPDPEVVAEWVMELVPVTPSTSLRVTQLRGMGMDPQDYRTSEPGAIRVDLPR